VDDGNAEQKRSFPDDDIKRTEGFIVKGANMASYLITCKPSSESHERGYPIEELQNLVRRLRGGYADEGKWRFQNTHAKPRDRVFLLIQGKLGPAIIGYGRVTGEPGRNDAGKRVVPIKFESLVDPSTEVLVGRDTLLAIPESHHVWRIPFSGMKLDDNIATILEALVVRRTPAASASIGKEEEQEFVEGACGQVTQDRRERSKGARDACIRIHGYTCAVCNMNFMDQYGEIGREFIHVHHIARISETAGEYKIDPRHDLVPVCPNCHAYCTDHLLTRSLNCDC
jgi:5-methylcytosine-specific restriction enzyme A